MNCSRKVSQLVTRLRMLGIHPATSWKVAIYRVGVCRPSPLDQWTGGCRCWWLQPKAAHKNRNSPAKRKAMDSKTQVKKLGACLQHFFVLKVGRESTSNCNYPLLKAEHPGTSLFRHHFAWTSISIQLFTWQDFLVWFKTSRRFIHQYVPPWQCFDLTFPLLRTWPNRRSVGFW